MDLELEKNINEAIEYLHKISTDQLDFKIMDPIAKMMLVALLHQSQKIKDYVDGVSEKIAEKYCEDFIPRKEIEAMPSLAILDVRFKPKKDVEAIQIGSGASFSYKLSDNKQQLNYIPVFNTLCIPYQNLYILTPTKLIIGDNQYNISMDNTNSVWVGIETKTEIDTLEGLSILIYGTGGVLPEHIYVGGADYELEYADMHKMEVIEMAEPFDAQQCSNQFFSIIDNWKDVLTNMGDKTLLYITDKIKDRDIFKPQTYPKVFKHWLESEILDYFKGNTIWLRLDFPKDYILSDVVSVSINTLPVSNVDVNNVTLTQTAPIAKLQKQDNSYFLQIIETSTMAHQQGFNISKDEIVIRDFDASSYHEGNLYRDIRNIYNHFIDDYYAFIEYNGIKDGETIKQLRDLINKLSKSVGTYSPKYNFDSGTYVMKNMNQFPQSSTVKVSFATTMGRLGNTPRSGEVMENKKLPLIEKDLKVAVSATGGSDKANFDERYENLRYYSLTNDRLYTKKDIEAFLRKEIITEFGAKEYNRILIKMDIAGYGGEAKLQRGLYITIEFKDKKNFDKAIATSFKHRVYQKIVNKSCVSMPINVNLFNLETL